MTEQQPVSVLWRFTASDTVVALDLLETLRERISALLRQRGLQPIDLARKVGKSPSWVSQVLSGQRGIRLETLDQIAVALEVEPWRLLVSREFPDEKPSRGPTVVQRHVLEEWERLTSEEREHVRGVIRLFLAKRKASDVREKKRA